LLDEDISVGDGPGQYEPPPEIQEPTDPDYFIDHIEDYVDATHYTYSYSYQYTSGGVVYTYDYSYDYTYYTSYFYFEETGEFIYVSTGSYEYTYNGVYSSYDSESSYNYSDLYGSTYYDTYIKTNTYYQSMMYTVDQSLMDQITDGLNKLKPIV
jgi:hypothetical protein